jgi:hypothetical protein
MALLASQAAAMVRVEKSRDADPRLSARPVVQTAKMIRTTTVRIPVSVAKPILATSICQNFTSRAPALRHRSWRIGSAWMAQEAEGASNRLIKTADQISERRPLTKQLARDPEAPRFVFATELPNRQERSSQCNYIDGCRSADSESHLFGKSR